MHTSIKEFFTSFCVGVESEHRLGHPAWARINSQSAYVNHCRSVIIEILVTCFATFKCIVKQVFCPSAAPINKRHTATFKIKYITYENCGEIVSKAGLQYLIYVFKFIWTLDHFTLHRLYRERPLMTSDIRVGRGVQGIPQNYRTLLMDVPISIWK